MSRVRGGWRVGARAVIGALVLAVAFAAAPVAIAGATDGGHARARAGLAQSWTTANGTWVVVPMGDLSSRTNTFWQVLFEPVGSTSWHLVTPEGVATNGGLSAAATPGDGGGVVVGIQASIDLRYSPLASTQDDGVHWRPGILGSRLAGVADAIAEEPSGGALALSSKGHGTLERSSGPTLTRWTTVTSTARLAASGAGRTCKVHALTAVAARLAGPVGAPDAASTPAAGPTAASTPAAGPTAAGPTAELGGECQAPGVVGIFEDEVGSWHLVGPRLRGSDGDATTTVLRLVSGKTGTAALVEAAGVHGSALFALWRSPGLEGWAVSAPVRVRGEVQATDQVPGARMAVLVAGPGHGGNDTLLVVADPGRAWRRLPRPPAGTQAIVGPASDTLALADHGSTMEVWQLGSRGWRRVGSFHVPIDYGSST